MLSQIEIVAHSSPAEQAAFYESLTDEETDSLLYDWRGFHARPNQIAPEGEWDMWLALAGRGFGKTRMGSEWIKECVAERGKIRIALIGETAADTRDVMVEGESGILSVYPDDEKPLYESSKRKITWSNGAIAHLYNATEPNQLRGPGHEIAWSDELAKWRYARATWDQLQMTLRNGDNPQQIVTTTPRPIELVKAIYAGDEGVVVSTVGRTMDNAANLAPAFLKKIKKRYEGTRLGRQELDAEILSDVPNALFTLDNIDANRRKFDDFAISDPQGRSMNPAELSRILVSVDHAISDTETSNEHGIIAVGVSQDETDGYVLEDASCSGKPLDWGRAAIALFDKWDADGIVIETNQGGDLVAQTLQSVRANIPIIRVHASRGKHLRAEPVSAMYQQGRIHHCGAFSDLETQMCLMTSAEFTGDGSPDRLDALVAGFLQLFNILTRPQKESKPFKILPMIDAYGRA